MELVWDLSQDKGSEKGSGTEHTEFWGEKGVRRGPGRGREDLEEISVVGRREAG